MVGVLEGGIFGKEVVRFSVETTKTTETTDPRAAILKTAPFLILQFPVFRGTTKIMRTTR